MKSTLLIFYIHLYVVGLSEAANILVMLPLPLYSHTNTFMPIFKELALRGHNITMVSTYPQNQPLPNWTDLTIDTAPFKEFIDKRIKEFSNRSVYVFFTFFTDFCYNLMRLAFQDENFQKLIKAENLNYDLVITESFFAHEPLVAFGHKLNAPVIAIHPLSLSPWPAYLTGNELSFTQLTNYRTQYTDRLSFLQRLDNMLVNILEFSVTYFFYLPKQEALMEKYMVYSGSENRSSLVSMLKNTSLTLIGYHYSVGYVQSLQPNSIPVGGLSVKHASELPKDLKQIMDSSKNGVIYLSFGSFVGKLQVSEKLLLALLKAFDELDITVFMKWENLDVPNKPKNVLIREWFPQASVLSHPNLRLFITHGGLHGITEASYYGVPVLGIPFFSDQEYNLKFIEQAGTGLFLHREEITKENLLGNIRKILQNPSYKEAASERSKIVKDRPQMALESSIYWIEYVLRNKGAMHLRPARLDLELYEIFSIDIIIFFLFIIFMSYFVIWKFITFLCLLASKKNTKSKKD